MKPTHFVNKTIIKQVSPPCFIHAAPRYPKYFSLCYVSLSFWSLGRCEMSDVSGELSVSKTFGSPFHDPDFSDSATGPGELPDLAINEAN